jgi:hypothetical protein
MKNWIATCGIGAGLFFTMACAAVESNRGTVIAKILGPSQRTSETALQGANSESALFWTTIEVKETRRYFDPELVGKKIRILTTPFSESLVGTIVPLEIIRVDTNSPVDSYRLAPYRFQCGEFSSGYFAGKFDEEKPHGIVIAKIVGPVNIAQQPPPAENKVARSKWIEIFFSESKDGSVIEYPWHYSQWVEIQVIEAKDGVADEMKGQSINLKTFFEPEDRELIGKTFPLEIYKSETANSVTGYFTRDTFKTSIKTGKMVEEKRQQAAAAKRP